jgi:uncharacterized membrane protein HdeD (DUF308 family)
VSRPRPHTPSTGRHCATWPGITVLALALLFGAWALLDGVSLLINAFRQGRAHAGWRDWVPSLLAGLLGIACSPTSSRVSCF